MKDSNPLDRPVWIDAHCHLADPRWSEDLGKVISECRGQGIGYFVQGGVSPTDWDRQVQLKNKHPGIICSVGLHPYFVSENTEEDCEEALDKFALKTGGVCILGEMGLDFRPPYEEQRHQQLDVFQSQLELAKVAKKPIILHVVRAFPEALKMLQVYGGRHSGYVHAFSGTWDKAKAFIDQGYAISIGGSVCHSRNEELQKAAVQIPDEYLLVESDSPDQAPPGWTKTQNWPTSIIQIADKLSELRGVTRAEILDISRRNCIRIIGEKNFAN